MLFTSVLAVAATASVASAAAVEKRQDRTTVQFIFPEGRTPNAAQAHMQPVCAGTTIGARTDFPLTGGQISVGQSAAIDNLNFLWSPDSKTFKSYGEPTVVDIDAGHYCAEGPDFSALGFKAGDDATILVMYQADGPPRRGTDKRWQYICADIKLVDNWTQPSGFMCAQRAASIRIAKPEEVMNVTLSDTQDGTRRGSQAAAAAADDDSLTLPQAGGIGAAATVGVFLVAAAALFAAGFRFTRKKAVHVHDDSSSTSSGVPTKQVQH